MQSSVVRADATVEFIDVSLGTCIDSISINDFQNRSVQSERSLTTLHAINIKARFKNIKVQPMKTQNLP